MLVEIDELLELGPAEALEQDALGEELGQRVDADPVVRRVAEAAHELPRAFRIVGQRACQGSVAEEDDLALLLRHEALGEPQRTAADDAFGERLGAAGA